MLTVIIITDNNHKYLNNTLKALKEQANTDFKIVIANPNYNKNIENGVQTPPGINNQINACVTKNPSDYYLVLSSGCIPWTNLIKNIFYEINNPYIVGPVHLCSKNQPPKYLCKPDSFKYGECDSKETANYNNFAFSRGAFLKHGGLNADKNTIEFFIKQFEGLYLPYNFVEKIVDFNTSERDDFYRINNDRLNIPIKWKPVTDIVPKKKKPNLLITIGVGNLAKEILSYTEENMYQYAEKINADYIQLTNQTQEWWGLEKFRIKDVAKDYDRVLFCDCDILIKENSPNIFKEVPDGYIGCVNDWDGNGEGTLKTNYWIRQEAKEMSWYQKRQYIPSQVYNSGVVVFNGYQSNIWEPPIYPFTYFHCTEQHWVEQNIRHNKYNVKILDNKWNCQYWRQDFKEKEKDAYFLHPAGKVDKLGYLYDIFSKNKSKIQDGQTTSLKFKKISFVKNKDYCIVTVCSDNSKLLKKTSKTHIEYAKKCNADYHTITENVNTHWPMGNKYLIQNFTEKYDKTLYLDSDVYVKRDSPDLFKITPDNEIGIHNESEELQDIEYHKHIKGVHDYICCFLNFPKNQVMSLNCGVMMIPKSISHLYTMPKGNFPAYWCFDQHYLLCLLKEYKMDYFEIGEKFNLEYIRKDWEEKRKSSWFIHLNGIKSETKRLKLIEKING